MVKRIKTWAILQIPKPGGFGIVVLIPVGSSEHGYFFTEENLKKKTLNRTPSQTI